ncbi:hypothetical protein ACKVMT_03025 [Halobacteriales archaeon Cl-PHB]
MESRLYRATVFALYQLTLMVGIAMLPLALVARRLGVPLPFHRAVTRLGEAYDRTQSA